MSQKLEIPLGVAGYENKISSIPYFAENLNCPDTQCTIEHFRNSSVRIQAGLRRLSVTSDSTDPLGRQWINTGASL